jgi:hypothetical protein
MPNFWDLLPASLWPAQPFSPRLNPGEGSGRSPSPPEPWESAASTPDDPAPDAGIPLGAPSASSGLLSQFDAYRDPELADDERRQQDLVHARRALALAQWFFGPPSEAPRAPTAAAMQAPTSRYFVTTPVSRNSFNDSGLGPFDFATSPAPPTTHDPFFPARPDGPRNPFSNPPVSRSAPNQDAQAAPPETTGQATTVEPFGGGYAPSSGEFLASRVSAHDLLKRGGARYDLDNYQIVSDGAAASHRDAGGNPDGLIFTGPAYIYDPATGAFANVSGSLDRPTSATMDINTGELTIRR